MLNPARTLPLLLAALLAGCANGQDDPNHRDAVANNDASASDSETPQQNVAMQLTVTPGDATLDVNQGAEARLQFTVTARYADGRVENDVPALLSSDLVGAGRFQGRTFIASGTTGGVANVAVSYAGAQTMTRMTLRLHTVAHDDTLSQDLVDRVMQSVPGATDDASLRPDVVYPNDHTVMPPNLYAVEWQWRPVANAVYLATFRSPTSVLQYVTARNMFVLTPELWRTLMLSNRGHEVELEVRAARATDLSHAGAASVHVTFTTQDLAGGIYYFTTNSEQNEQGIFRYDFGTPQPQATRFLSQTSAGGCVGCHTLSRDGTRMSVTFEGGYGNMATLMVSDPGRFVAGGPQGPSKGAFNGFIDDGRSVLSVYDNWLVDENDPRNGQIRVWDFMTGAVDDARQIPIGDGHRAAHVDVAPDARSIAYVDYSDVQTRPIHEAEGSIRIVSYDPASRAWGEPHTLVPYDGIHNNYYPAFSPDGQWILFNRAPGDAYDNAQASVWVVPVDGSHAPIELAHANQTAGLTNSWPRWAPFMTTDEIGTTRMWITFSSKRDYGLRLAGWNRPQIWMAAFDPMPTRGGADGSSPAFWLPFQNILTQNHTASWTTRIVPRNCVRDSDCLDSALVCEPVQHTCTPAQHPG